MFEGFPLTQWLTSGTPPQWILLFVIVFGVLRYGPLWQKQSLDAKASMRAGQAGRITELEDLVRQLRIDCDKETRELRNEITLLHNELSGMKDQRIQEQISLIYGILETVESPELKKQLKMLESVKGAMTRRNVLRTQVEPVLQTGIGKLEDDDAS